MMRNIQLNMTIAEMRELSRRDRIKWREKARETYGILLELAEHGGADECESDDLRIAAGLNLKKNYC